MTIQNIPSGIIAALPTPVQSNGRPDVDTLSLVVNRLISAGVAGLCVGGATGEYACFEVEDRIRIFKHVGAQVAGRVSLICGIGAESSTPVLQLAHAAAECGAAAALLPPPSYFPFSSGELAEMLTRTTSQIPLPILLYHIPQFTNPLQPLDALTLVRSVGKIVGIKDSSGDRETLAQYSAARRETDFVLMAGSDDLLLTALELGANGGISGICSIMPQLVLEIYAAFNAEDRSRALQMQSLLDELADALGDLPVPWGIKIALEVQGFSMGCSTWPTGPQLRARTDKFRQWFAKWMPEAQSRLPEPK